MKRGIFDLELLSPILILLLVSLTTLLGLDKALFQNQLVFIVLGLLAFFAFSTLDYRFLKSFMLPFFVVSVMLLLLLIFFGTEARGAVRWFSFFQFRIQVSEVLKPFLLISFASFLTRNEGRITLATFLLSLLFISIVSLPVFLQPDLGNTLVYMLVPFMMLIFFGTPVRWFGILALILLTLSPLLWQVLRDYQRERVLSFLHPTADPLGSSYNLIQAVIAVGSGQFFGRGLGHGTQSQLKFLPERHTDFIFASISENFGFIGGSLVLASFVFLLFRIYKIVREGEDSFGVLFSVGAFSLLLIHMFINVGMNVGILPITGITLPLVSYGGSSLLSTCILLGIINSIGRGRAFRKTLEIR